jgi:methyltransferase (TIGR00027 family)
MTAPAAAVSPLCAPATVPMLAAVANLTSLKVLRGVLYLDAHEELRRLLPEGYGALVHRVLWQAGLHGKGLQAMLGHPLYRRLAEGRRSREVLLHLALRKRFVHDELEAALDDGATQVVNVGAGLDPLLAGFAPRWPSARFFEIDRAETLAPKVEALHALGLDAPNLRPLDADLAARPLGRVLDETPTFRREAPTVFLAEGLLMYLPPFVVRHFFEQARVRMGAGRLVFTFLPEDAAWAGPLTRWTLAATGNAVRFRLPPERLEGFLQELGLRIQGDPARFDLAARYLADTPWAGASTADFEHVAVAARHEDA